ncbi:kinesin-like protein Klp61F [Anopheles cruzii]|uniref:kinesin-like protein Klp61F n=1 Tax=Anopheles cruzii TaxID=68878 RepID=UPI0022EC3BB5|nr:kinesin-like protein Klp61F [Anopheles cruzii]
MDASNGNHSNSGGKPIKCNQNVQVYVRVRPTNTREKLIRSLEVVDVVSHRELQLKSTYLDSRTSKKFTFDRAFDAQSKQHEVYQAVVAPYIEEVLSGFNCTVFAYGQTGTGKTFTMVGEEEPELSAAWEDDTSTGVIPRAVNHLFDELRMTNLEFSMRISYLELYNEELCDLLSTDDSVKIRIFDDVQKKGSVIVQGLEEIPVHSKDDVYKLLAKGQERRKTASTLMNAQSSRSHTIFSIIVHIKENNIDGEEMLKIGKLNLVDLAGSENISKAGNEKGIRTRETVNINQSLLTLGRVITALVEKTPHIPYRESKLTRLLQESLGGRTKTSIIATISPGHKDFEETLSTLEYAHRAKNIQNKPEANQRLSKKTVIKEYTEEIDRLKRDLMAARDKNGIYLAEQTYNEMVYKSESATKELNDKSALIKAMKEELSKKESIFKEVSGSLADREEELRRTAHDLGQARVELTSTRRSLTKTKRRYVEKKVILDHHLKTEQALTGQAKELINVVEMVTEDTNGLHDTVDRRKEIDCRNKNATGKFVDSVRQRIRTIAGDVTGMVHECSQLTTALNSGLESYNQCEQELYSQTTGHLATLDMVNQSLMQQNSSLAESLKSTIAARLDGSGEESAKYLEQVDRLRSSMMAQFVSILAGLKSTIRETVHRQQDDQRQQFQALLTHCQTFEGKKAQFCASLKDQLSEVDKLLVTFDNSRERLREFGVRSQSVQHETLEAVKAIESAKALALLNAKALEDQLTGILQRMHGVSEQRQQLTDIVDDVCGDIERKQQTAGEALTTMGCSIAQEETIDGQCTADRELLTKRESELMTQHRNSFETKLEEVRLTGTIETSSRELATTIEQERLRLTDAQQHIRQCLDTYAGSLGSQNAAFQQSQQDTLTRVAQGVQAQQSARQQFAGAATGHTQRIVQALGAYAHKATDQQLVDLQAEVERFHQRDLTFYQPTGQTPIRKKVPYPREIPMTSPDERILRKYWRDRAATDAGDPSMTICEDGEELIAALDTSYNRCDEIRNSTPLLQKTINVLDDDRTHFKELQISNIDSKIGSVHLLDDSGEGDKENKVITETGSIVELA